jgi:ABC-2 type transport system ATP-binding protein
MTLAPALSQAPSVAPPLTQAVISVKQVSKWYGNVVAVSDVSFEIRPGIAGLLGPNGAGKTTLLRMMSGLASVSDGELRTFGEDPRDNVALYKRIGVMAEHESVYGFLTGREFVRFAAKMRGVPDPDGAARKAIAAVDLVQAQDRSMGGYSRGMKQRMRLAATIVHEPELLILDEPLNGADPRQRIEFQALLKRQAQEGRTIVVSSHILEEVEQLADSVLLIVNGKLAASGNYRAIRAALDKRPYHVRVVSSDPRSLASGLVRLPSVDAVNFDPGGALIVLSTDVSTLQRKLPEVTKQLGIRLTRVEPLDDSLESVFGYLVER